MRKVTMPSGLTLLGIVKHLTWVEEGWFGRHLHGDDLELTDNATSFVLTPSDTVASVIAAYEVAIEESRRIAAATSLDERARIPTTCSDRSPCAGSSCTSSRRPRPTRGTWTSCESSPTAKQVDNADGRGGAWPRCVLPPASSSSCRHVPP